MSLDVQAYSGARSGVANPGWKDTSAAFFIAALRAMYGDDFGFEEVKEFKRLNDLEDWEPFEDLRADGVLIGGTIYTPDGFDLSGWADYYADWKAGRLDVFLPEPVEVTTYVPTNLGWSPSQPAIIETKPQSQTTTAASSAAQSVATTAASQPIATPPKKKTESGVPGWVWVAGGVAGLAVLHMAFGKKGRR